MSNQPADPWKQGLLDPTVRAPQLRSWLGWAPWLGWGMVGLQLLHVLGNASRGNVNIGTPFDVGIQLCVAAFLLLPFGASPLHPAALPPGMAPADVPWDPRLGQPGLFRLLTRMRVGLASMGVLGVASWGLYPAIWLLRRRADLAALGAAIPAWLAAVPLVLGLARLGTIGVWMGTTAFTSRVGFATALAIVAALWWAEMVGLAIAATRAAPALDAALAPHVQPVPRWLLWIVPTYALERQLDRLRVRAGADGRLGLVAEPPRRQPIAALAVATVLASGLVAYTLANFLKIQRAERHAAEQLLARLKLPWPPDMAAQVALADRLIEEDPAGENVLGGVHYLLSDVRGTRELRARANLVNARVQIYGALTGPHAAEPVALSTAGVSLAALLAGRPEETRAWVLKGWVLHLEGDNKAAKAALDRATGLDPNDAKAAILRMHLMGEENGQLRPILGDL